MDDTEDSAHGDAAGAAAHSKLRDHVDTETAKLGDPPRLERRPRPLDRARGNYERRPITAALTADSTAIPADTPAALFKRAEQTLTVDSTAFPAGTPAVPFKRTAASEAHVDGARGPVTGEKHSPRRIETLAADGTPKRPHKKSRYEALPPSTPNLPAASEDLTAADTKSLTGAASLNFEALRAALLAEARNSGRGGKR
jgi:hypothetical protein